MIPRQSAQGAGHHSGIGSGDSSELGMENRTVPNTDADVAIGLPTWTDRRAVPSTDIQPDD
jgi:hypothetical protein